MMRNTGKETADLSKEQAEKLVMKLITEANAVCQQHNIAMVAAVLHSEGEKIQSYGNASEGDTLNMISFLSSDCAAYHAARRLKGQLNEKTKQH